MRISVNQPLQERDRSPASNMANRAKQIPYSYHASSHGHIFLTAAMTQQEGVHVIHHPLDICKSTKFESRLASNSPPNFLLPCLQQDSRYEYLLFISCHMLKRIILEKNLKKQLCYISYLITSQGKSKYHERRFVQIPLAMRYHT